MHMTAARLGYKRAMVGIRWANSHPGCMHTHKIIAMYIEHTTVFRANNMHVMSRV